MKLSLIPVPWESPQRRQDAVTSLSSGGREIVNKHVRTISSLKKEVAHEAKQCTIAMKEWKIQANIARVAMKERDEFSAILMAVRAHHERYRKSALVAFNTARRRYLNSRKECVEMEQMLSAEQKSHLYFQDKVHSMIEEAEMEILHSTTAYIVKSEELCIALAKHDAILLELQSKSEELFVEKASHASTKSKLERSDGYLKAASVKSSHDDQKIANLLTRLKDKQVANDEAMDNT